MKNGKNLTIKIILLFVILIISSILSICLFPTPLNFSMDKERLIHILIKIRLPEILIAITAGA